MGRLADAAREQEATVARLTEMLVDLAERAEASDEERRELADLIVTLGGDVLDNANELNELDPSYADEQADLDDQADEGDGG